MGKFDGILICSDFDGTLAYKAKISDKNRDAIKYFQSEGGLFTLVSGRQSRFFDSYADTVMPNTYIIGLNGAEIYDRTEDRALYRRAMNKRETLELSYRLLTGHSGIKRVGIHDFVKCYFYTLDNWDEAESMDEISKVIFYVESDASERLRDAFKVFVPENYVVERSWINGIELLDAENVKGRSVKRLREMSGERARKVICVGDYENDISMLREADIGYAVDGAKAVVRAAADRMTTRVTEDAIAHVIEDIENELRTAPGSFWREAIK